MTPEELSRIREIYEQALPMNGSARDACLDRECRGNQGMREEVERLLRARENIPTWLDRPAVGGAKPFVAPELPKLEGRHFSGYTLVREIGRGGMGVVYLAERSDETFHRRAAIKLVLPPVNSTAVVARFQQEREILAWLDHPNIAKLLDAGVTEEGWPYFVMEYVDGKPIHRWCDERRLNISQRLELFHGVIDAVRYAHQHLVVHRDLKPSNIFVTNDGVVKLLDFGIAKVLSPPIAGKAPETVTLAAMLTPEYASPEQVNGTLITTQSDVYSLGVVLYELLTGHRPYRLLSAAMHEMARVIAEVEPARPSDVVVTSEPAFAHDRTRITPDMVSAVREGDPNRLRKRLLGDVDSILLMALQKEPGRRYGSVEAFGQDLGRHLESKPVAAREDSVWYRAGRFVRRHPEGALTACLVATIFVAGLITTIWEVRTMVDALGTPPSGRALLAPQFVLLLCVTVAAFGVVTYLLRANLRRVIASLAGGAIYALVNLLRLRAADSMGWWKTVFAETPDPFSVFSVSILVPILALTGAWALLISWRILRRFGWGPLALYVLAWATTTVIRDRLWYGEFQRVMVIAGGTASLVAEAAFVAAGLVLGHALMHFIAGPARKDPLARTLVRRIP